MKVAIVTRRLNKYLYERMSSSLMIDGEHTEILGYDGVNGARGYLYHCFAICKDYDIVINIDEDCFVIDNRALNELVSFFVDCKFDFCGMPDGGRCIHREHNPLVMNPFFNIFSKRFVTTINDNILDVKFVKMNSELKQGCVLPDLYPDRKFKLDNFEPYYNIFLAAHMYSLIPLYLDSAEWIDQISTILKNQNQHAFLVHTWYSREYERGSKSFHTERIDKCYFDFMRDRV